ncbi:MAG: HAMP domain-containing protein [Actinomycetaceae bacterium]|nr:HAMP domain-containing protein [Actinomycetaceae bacterium]
MTLSPEIPLAPALTVENAEVDKSVRGRLARVHSALCSRWHTSRQFRLLTFVMTVSLVAMILIGSSVVAAVRSHVFDRTIATSLERYEGSYLAALSLFSSVDNPSDSQIQRLADQVIATQYNTTDEVVGVVLLPSVTEENTYSIKLPNDTSRRLSMLITEEFRKDVNKSVDAQWREVALPADFATFSSGASKQNSDSRAIIVGQTIDVPDVGIYEFYIAYSLDNDKSLIRSIRWLLVAGFAGVFGIFVVSAYAITNSVLRPVRDVATKAQQIADGNYDVRMAVKGKDELAQLSRSFNRMASSIQDQFARYERVANVQQGFVSAVSHELRTPVTTIRMAGQLLYDKREDLPNHSRRSVELQHEQLINLDTMLSDLLEISRYDAGAMELNREETVVASIVAKAVADQIPLAEANGVEVKIIVEGDTAVEGERRRIERIIRNLLVNALEHSEGNAVRVRVIGGDNAVAVEVSDRGVGLTEEQAANVFKRFWRADSSRVRKSGGTGLGMTLAREDAELHGGTLECAGVLDVGSTFLLTLPRKPGADFEPPCPLMVAALEDDWDDETPEQEDEEVKVFSWFAEDFQRTIQAHAEEKSEVLEEKEVAADETVPPHQHTDEDDEPQNEEIDVTIPSAGVAIIKPPEPSERED